jgi:hypothetical protein
VVSNSAIDMAMAADRMQGRCPGLLWKRSLGAADSDYGGKGRMFGGGWREGGFCRQLMQQACGDELSKEADADGEEVSKAGGQ